MGTVSPQSHSMKVTPGSGSSREKFPSSAHSHMKMTHESSNDAVAPTSSVILSAHSKTPPVGPLSVSPATGLRVRQDGLVEGQKDGLVRHPVGRSLHLSHVPLNQPAIAEREDSVPASVF